MRYLGRQSFRCLPVSHMFLVNCYMIRIVMINRGICLGVRSMLFCSTWEIDVGASFQPVSKAFLADD